MAGGSIPAQLAPIFQAAGRQFGIPAAVLAGISSVESNLFRNLGPSSTGARGGMQFEPGTARSLGVNPNDPRSAIFGAAKLLIQYGYRQNPTKAIASYNAGPGNFSAGLGYAQQVTSEARRLASQLHGGSAGLPGMAPQVGTVPVTTQSFDQAGFKQALGKFIAGQAVKQSSGSANPFNATPGASKGLSSLDTSGPLFAKGLLTTSSPNPADFVSQHTTLQHATGALQQLAGSSLANIHAGAKGYVNPIPGAVIGRTDMGVDANLKPGAPIRAIGDSRVVGISPNWYQGQPYVLMQLLSGPQKGKYWYVAEQIAPSVRAGQTVRVGQPIGTYAQSGTGIEIGWGSPTPGRTMAQAQGNTGGAGHANSPAGQNFRSFLGSL